MPPKRVAIEGSVFKVRQRAGYSQAIRVNAQYAPRSGPITLRAVRAMQAASGCRVTEIKGDAALLLGALACGDTPAPTLRRKGSSRISLDCYDLAPAAQATSARAATEFDCDLFIDG